MKIWGASIKEESPKMIVKHAMDNKAIQGLATYMDMLRNMSFETPKTNKQKSNDKSKRKMAKKSKRKNR
ncbi:hypothetical protein Kirov_121 [Bacillus phage Kirov]|uniref:Uncharacterized protein n=1 Tax=Bacillus phage Kirov TaxID=2783539 RepID=A0A7U3RYB1_9CAUD|nr:hypothetical protein PQE67_gp183 [Bacillus phage Kirov]QOV08320.1 hypothetical protein Kirov_121 [Bacillus phage Kirov]